MNFSLEKLLDEAVHDGKRSALARRAIQEKEKQAASSSSQVPSSDASGLFDGGNSDSDESPPEGNVGGKKKNQPASSKTTDSDDELLRGGEVRAEHIVDKLNTIRSGKSFRDSTVSVRMSEYINSLSKAERTALLAFLKGIAQVVVGEIPSPEGPTEPDASPADVEMTKGEKQKTKSLEPNVIRTAAANVKKTKSSGEDTSAPEPSPITPVRRKG